jgi:predicted Zn-dependent protease
MHSEPNRNTPRWRGHLTNGRTARAVEVEVMIGDAGVQIAHPGADAATAIWLYDTLQASAPIHKATSEVLLLSRPLPGATLFLTGDGFAQALVAHAPHLSLRAARLDGIKPGLAVGALVFALVGATYAFDIAPSKGLARLMPEHARTALGNSVLRSLPTQAQRECTEAPGLEAVKVLALRLRPELPDAGARITVRDWNIVNAFAVPGDRVVLTRAIIEKATGPDEIAAVLAHEIGHGIELHPEAGLVRSVGFWALIQMMFTGTPGALGNAGTLLAQLAYTRTAEREADDHALAMLKRAGISQKPMAEFFRRMLGTKPDAKPGPRRLFDSDLFSTHPNTPERIAKIEGQPAYATSPALTDAQWQALRRICGGVVINAPSSEPRARVGQPAPQATFEAQIKAASERIDAAPTDAAGYQNRGEIYQRQNRAAEALPDFDRAIELAPKNANYRYARGVAYQALKQYDKAIADYTEAFALNPRYAAAVAARGSIQRLQKNHAAALDDTNQALAINPRFQGALMTRALVHIDMENWDSALTDLNSILETSKAYAYAYAQRGTVYEKRNERDKAIADYRAALSGAPSSANAAEGFTLARGRLKTLGAAER